MRTLTKICTSALMLAIATPALAVSLSDIQDNKNKGAIEYLNTKGVIGGYPDGTFRPMNTVNRAELLKILVGGKGVSPEMEMYNSCFPDVINEWFAPFVCYAKEQGWVGGYPDGTFRPANTVNTAEAIKMVVNAQGYEVPASVQTSLYDDVDGSTWYAPYVKAAKDKGILEPSSGSLGVSDNMKRGGISEVIYRSMYVREKGIERFPEQVNSENGSLTRGEYMSQLYALITKAYDQANDMISDYQTLPSKNAKTVTSLKNTLENGMKSVREMERLMNKAAAGDVLTSEEETAFDTHAQNARDKVKEIEETMTTLLDKTQSNSSESTKAANTSFPINLLNNQDWKIRITAQFDEYTDEQSVFEVTRKKDVLLVSAFNKNLKSGKLSNSPTEWEARFSTAYYEPKDPYLELNHCWYKYEYIREGFTCEFHRIPVQVSNSTVQGDWSFEHLITSASDEYKVEILNKSATEVQCNIRAETTEDDSKVYYSKDSAFFEKVRSGFKCFGTESDAQKAGYSKSYQ